MSPAARSILVYSIYLFGQGLALLVAPNIALRLFGLPETSEVWVRIVGMAVAPPDNHETAIARKTHRFPP